MSCGKCGKPLLESARYCAACGTPAGAGGGSASRPSEFHMVGDVMQAVVVPAGTSRLAVPRSRAARGIPRPHG